MTGVVAARMGGYLLPMRASFPSSMILLVALAHPASAQDGRSDIVIDAVSVTGAESGEGGPFLPDTRIDAVVDMRNRGDDPLDMRRIVIQSSGSLFLIDPVSDTLDNDADGTVDDAAEALQRNGRDGAAWRFRGDGLRIEPGESLRRTLRFRVRPDALAGTSGFFSLSTGTTLAEGPRSRPQRTRRVFPVAFVPPRPSLVSSAGGDLTLADEPILTASVVLPGGIVPDARLLFATTPSLRATGIDAIETGNAITCASGDADLTEDGAEAMLGRCAIDGAGSQTDRTIRFAVRTMPVDAGPDASDAAIDAWRDIGATLTVSSGRTILATTRFDSRLVGPLAKVTALPDDPAFHRPGDTLSRRYRIENRGDRPLVAPRIRIANTETFTCRSIAVEGRTDTIPCDGSASLPSGVAPGEAVVLTVTARLRSDAVIEADTGLAVDLVGETPGTTSFPVTPLRMVPHANPTVEIVMAKDWATEGALASGTVGQSARLRIRGTLPAGRYPGDVRLLARMVDARTGAPVMPAVVDIGRARLTILGPDGETVAETRTVESVADTIWSQHVLPFDLREDEGSGGSARGFTADLDVTLADDPSIRVDRLLELTAESTAYGDSTVASTSWIEVLVTEPDLRLKLFSLDEDRIIHPGEPLAVVVLACNYGDGAAHDTSLRLALPARLDAAATATRAFTIPLEAVQTRAFGVLSKDATPEDRADVMLDGEEGLLTLDQGGASLDPRRCLGVEMRGSLGIDRTGSTTNVAVEARLNPYYGIPNRADARRYPGGGNSILRFRVPAVRFGPSETIRLDGARRVEHPLSLDVPAYLGPFRLSLSPESSTGLDWALFERSPTGKLSPWVEGANYPAGTAIDLTMRADAPTILPLGWADTSTLRAVILADDGRSFAATLRLVIRGGSGPSNAIETSKRVALDRDCDGALGDEIAQDAVFEAGKDAAIGDCLIVRIEFANAGDDEIERIVIRDALSARTTLLPGSTTVRISPEPLDRLLLPDPARDILEWEFEGLFRPGAVGEVEYGLRLDPPIPAAGRP